MRVDLTNLKDGITDYYDEFVLTKITTPERIARATVVVRAAAEAALVDRGYDVSKPFHQAIISCFEVSGSVENGNLKWAVVHNFKDIDIENRVANKDGKTPESSISSLKILEFLDGGRPGYTIEGKNTTHGLIAIPPPGQAYDPSNKKNKIRASVAIPALSPAHIFDRVQDALDAWIAAETVSVIADFAEGVTEVFQKEII